MWMHMKKTLVMLASAALLLMTSCGTYTGQGAYVGGSFGSILGSAIGGIAGGWRGSDIGTVVGMAGGAAVGAAMGSAADKKQAEQIEQYKRERASRYGQRDPMEGVDAIYDGTEVREVRRAPSTDGRYDADDSGFDATGSGDDRIDFDGAGPINQRRATAVSVATDAVSTAEPLHIRNVRIIDADHDGVLRAGEQCRISFEVMNRSSMTVYDVQPLVAEVTGNERIHISPNLHVESIAPHTGIRYTASLVADRKLKDGSAVIRVGVAQGNRQYTSQTQELVVQTSRK